MRGLVLFGHGARDPRWADPLVRLRERFARLAPDTPVVTAFLEIMSPDLAGAIGSLTAWGCTSITVVPVFLGQGGHVRRDLAGLVQAARKAHPGIQIETVSAVGEDDAVLDELARYCLRSLAPETRKEMSDDDQRHGQETPGKA